MRNELKYNNEYVTFAADKNLGVALIENGMYNHRAWNDHLLDESTYKIIPPNRVQARKVETQYQIDKFLSKCQDVLPLHELFFSVD